jgi:hypothetical protein
MKRFLVLLLLFVLLAGCGDEQLTVESGQLTVEPEDIYEPAEIIETPEEPEIEPEPEEENEPEPRESDFSALELIGYRVDEDGRIIIGGWENECSPDVLREYTFGTWEGWNRRDGYLIIDDSEENNCFSWLMGGFYKYDNIIIFRNGGHATQYIYWLDISEPDIMHYIEVAATGDNSSVIYWYNVYEDEGFTTNFVTKTDTPIKEPENRFLSILRLYEIERDYGINRDLLFEYRYIVDDYYHFTMNYFFSPSPKYLISQSPDKLVLKSSISYFWEHFIDIEYTLEKINGEWVRTVEVDMEQLEEVINELRN